MSEMDLIEKMNIEGVLTDMGYVSSLQKEIAFLNTRYHVRSNNKQFELADVIDQLIVMYKQELENATRSIASNSCEILPSPVTGNKRIFVLER